MELKPYFIGVAVVAFLAAAGLLFLAVRVLRRSRHRWTSAFAILPALCLLALVAVLVPPIFDLNVPRGYFNAPAPVPDTARIYSEVGTGLDVDGHTLVAADARTGKQRWQSLAMGHGTTFAEDGDTLIAVAHNQNGVDVSAIDGMTGAERWHQLLPTMWSSAPPLILDGTVIVSATAITASTLGVAQIYAFRLSDGQQLWRIYVGNPDSSAPRMYGGSGVLITQFSNDVMQAWNVSNGKQLWYAPQFDGTVVVGANIVFELRRDGSINALSAWSGAELWQSRVDGTAYGEAIMQNAIYISAEPNAIDANGLLFEPATVYAFDLASGHQLWSFVTADVGTSGIVADTSAVFVTQNKGMVALRPSDGKLLWRNMTPGLQFPTGFSPFVGSVLYAHDVENVPAQRLLGGQGQTFLYALNQNTGVPYWKVPIGPLVTTHGIGGF